MLFCVECGVIPEDSLEPGGCFPETSAPTSCGSSFLSRAGPRRFPRTPPGRPCPLPRSLETVSLSSVGQARLCIVSGVSGIVRRPPMWVSCSANLPLPSRFLKYLTREGTASKENQRAYMLNWVGPAPTPARAVWSKLVEASDGLTAQRGLPHPLSLICTLGPSLPLARSSV